MSQWRSLGAGNSETPNLLVAANESRFSVHALFDSWTAAPPRLERLRQEIEVDTFSSVCCSEMETDP